MDGSALDEGGRSFRQTQDVVKEPLAKLNWVQLGVLDNIGLREYLSTDRLDVLLVKGDGFCIESNELIELTGYVTFNQLECSRGCYKS